MAVATVINLTFTNKSRTFDESFADWESGNSWDLAKLVAPA